MGAIRSSAIYLCACVLGTSLAFANTNQNSDYNGTATVNGCSGSLFIMKGMSRKQKALVISNGHCVNHLLSNGRRFEYLAPGQFLWNMTGQQVTENSSVTVNGLYGYGHLVSVETLLFATMTGTDIAVYQLKQTYQDLKSLGGIDPLVLDMNPLQIDDPVLVHAAYFNRTMSCAMAGNTSLREGDYHTSKAVRLSLGCKIYSGFSGSPILRADGKTMTGMANTHFDGTGEPCSFNNPCEVSSSTGEIHAGEEGQSYGVPLDALYDCLDPVTHELNFRLPACAYQPKPHAVFKNTEREK